MRWAELFRYLEETGVPETTLPSVGGGHQAPDDTLLDLCLRAKSKNSAVTAGLVTGQVFHIWPRAVGREWFSGLIGHDQQAGVMIPRHAIEWLESDVAGRDAAFGHPTRATFHDALSDMVHRSQRVTVETLHRRQDGVISSVGLDYVDIRPTPDERGGLCRRLSLSAVVIVTVGTSGWG